MKFALIIALFLLSTFSEVANFSDSVMARIYQFHLDALIFFQGDELAEVSSFEELKRFEATQPGFTIILLSKNQNQKAFAKVSNFYGIDVSKTPQILYLNNQKIKYVFQSDDVTSDNIASFISGIKNGTVLPYYKSEPIPQSNDQRIKKVVGKTFKEIVLDTEKQVLVYFYGPKCAHCLHFTPHFQQMAQKLAKKSHIVFAKFDATKNEVDGQQIQTLPTVRFWRKNKASSLQYPGKYKADLLMEWLKENTEYPLIQTEETVQETL